jgi:hypothetical protein
MFGCLFTFSYLYSTEREIKRSLFQLILKLRIMNMLVIKLIIGLVMVAPLIISELIQDYKDSKKH